MNHVNCYRKIHLESAIKNVGLLADNIWATNNLDKEYKQRNQDLWIRFNEAEELGRDINDLNKSQNNVETVKDRIPQSRLAKYGNFTYDKSEELFYYSNTENDTETQYKINNINYSEFWYCPEVDQEFWRLTSPLPLRLNTQHQKKAPSKPSMVFEEDPGIEPLKTTMSTTPSQWLQNQPWPTCLLHNYPSISDSLSSLDKSLFNQGLNSDELKKSAAIIRHPPLRYSLNSPSEYELHMKLNAASMKEIWDAFFPYIGSSISKLFETESNDWKLTLPMIGFNCEVPEFYPKTIIHRNWQMLPSASDPNYQVDLFPYQPPNVSAPIPVPSVSPATTQQPQTITSTSAPSTPPTITPSLNNSFTSPAWNHSVGPISPQPIPVFQRPPEFYAQSEGVKPHRKRGGVEFSNLILLGRGSENANNINGNTDSQITETTGRQEDGLSMLSTEQTLNSEMISPLNRQVKNRSVEEMNMEKVTLEQINIWLDKVYPQRSEHFSEMMSTVDTIYNLASEVNKMDSIRVEPVMNEPGCHNDLPGTDNNNSDLSQIINKGTIKKIKTPNSSNSSSPQRPRRLYRDVLSGEAENRFAQLEQEALEQYQPSDHNISIVASEETLAQRYQDLEREALEQYRGDRDDWFTVPLTGEDNGGSGVTEEDPDPPLTITSRKTVLPHNEIMEVQQVGTEEEEEEEEVIVEENQGKEDTKVTKNYEKECNKQDPLSSESVNSIQVYGQKTPVWMKHKKKKQDKKRKIGRHKKDCNVIQSNQQKRCSKFLSLINDFQEMVLSYSKNQNKKLRKADKKRMSRQVMHHLNKINNSIINSQTLNELKFYTDATSIVTFGRIIGPCIQGCLEVNNQQQYSCHDIGERRIILKTLSTLFMPFFKRKSKHTSLLTNESYKTKYLEITENYNMDRCLNQINHKLKLIMNKYYTGKDYYNLCETCLLNRVLSRLAWSCFQTFISRLLSFAKFSPNLTNDKTKYQLFTKNTSLYEIKFNNQFGIKNIYYDRHCNDLMNYTDWLSIGSLINVNSRTYFINENINGLIKDWSWIYHQTINEITKISFIDSVIDEAAIIHFNTLLTEVIDHTCLIFQINWFDNEPCYYCNGFTIVKCFNDAYFIRNSSCSKKQDINHYPIKGTPRYSRKCQLNKSVRKCSSSCISQNNNDELIRMHKKGDERIKEQSIRKRTLSDGALNKNYKYSNENIPPNKKRHCRTKSLPKDNSGFLEKMYCNNTEILHYVKNHKKHVADRLQLNRYEQIMQSGDEPSKSNNSKCQSNTKKHRKIKGLNKALMKFPEKEKADLNKHSCKHSCNIQ